MIRPVRKLGQLRIQGIAWGKFRTEMLLVVLIMDEESSGKNPAQILS